MKAFFKYFIKYISVLTNVYISIYSGYCYSLTFNISSNSDIVGTKQTIFFKEKDTLQSIARSFDLAITELIGANPGINPKNIKVGTKLVIPTEFILPSGAREGIVLNLAEFRIYYFSEDRKTVATFPVGIGRLGWQTPLGETKVVRKRDHPTWVPPPSIRKYSEDKGKILPDFIPPGPHNPLGEYAMNLAWSNYLIHGTNSPSSIGLRSSSGCIRMYPEDIKTLFNLSVVGTKVRVVHEPIKLGKKGSELYIEVHESFKEKYYNDEELTEQELLENIINEYYQRFKSRIDWGYANKNLKNAIGYPVDITNH
jgi:L,D-transpeptidase ErfK/SrfK